MNCWGLILALNIRDPFLVRYDLLLIVLAIQNMICKRVVMASGRRLHGELHFLIDHLLHEVLGFTAESSVGATVHPIVNDRLHVCGIFSLVILQGCLGEVSACHLSGKGCHGVDVIFRGYGVQA